MTNQGDHPNLEDVVGMDPTRADTPPEPGSIRYDSILERSMTTNDSLTEQPDNASVGAGVPLHAAHPEAKDIKSSEIAVGRRSRTGRALVTLAAAVVIVIALVVVGPFGSSTEASASEVVTIAARTTGDETAFRGALVIDEGGEVRRSTAEVDGLDIRVTAEGSTTPAFVVIDGVMWSFDENGSATSEPVEPGGGLEAFGPSSEAVVLAALQSSSIEELGDQEIRGQVAAHYRISLDDTAKAALGALSPGQLAWFDLENPQQASTLEVWVSDDLVRRIEVQSTYGDSGNDTTRTASTEFYDFGADITIEPPA